MNWKNVLFIMRVERKSGRLIRGIKATRYRENKFLAYWPYWAAAIIGIIGGLGANFIAQLVYSDPTVTGLLPLSEETLRVFVLLPTLVLIFSLVFSLMQQIQVSGVKATTQVNYWLPVTWQEHTLASIFANLLGWPVALVIGITSGVLVFSVFNGLILQALLTVLVLFAVAFMASSITEILRITQVRFMGAVYKSSGRAAIGVRFVGSLVFFIIFFITYFYVINGPASFLNTLTTAQNAAWYVPFLWLALTLSYIIKGSILQGILFVSLSALFIGGLYYLAVLLNQRFGLYEPPAITVQRSGIYAPKTGLLGKIGFAAVEAAIIRKDLRAFTRRRELISIFITPVIMIIIPIMDTLGVMGGSSSSQTNPIFMGIIFLLPAGFMAMLLGETLIGEEGQAVWRIYASPISPKNLVKSKFFFIVLFSTVTLLISGAIGAVFFHPSLDLTIVFFLETFFLVLALGSASLAVGFKGADFSQTRRARMIRQDWSLIGLIVCALAGAAVLAPIAPYAIALYASSFIPGLSASLYLLAISVVISAIVSLAITAVFYKIDVDMAKDLLRKAQT
jgi:hypothetical protein